MSFLNGEIVAVMLKYIFCICLWSLCWACHPGRETRIEIRIENGHPETETFLCIGDKEYRLSLDSLGFASFVAETLPAPLTGELRQGNYSLPLFVEPLKSFGVYMNLCPESFGAEFSGEGALKNDIWNGKYFQELPDSVYGWKEEKFVEALEANRNRNDCILDSLTTDSLFSVLVRRKFECMDLKRLTVYPERYSEIKGDKKYIPSEFYRNYVRNQLKEDRSMLKYASYRQALSSWVAFNATADRNRRPAFEALEAKLEYVDTFFTDAGISEFLTDKFVTAYVEREGIDSLHRIKRWYDRQVKQTALKSRFEQLCREWQRIGKGQPCPVFEYRETDTTTVSLKDLAGKYVYMALWDTDSRLSRKELAAFRELAARLKKKNTLCFAGIACRGPEVAWKQIIGELTPGGVQLFAGEDTMLTAFFKITELPCFILLDPSGRILNSRMTPPSDPETEIQLKKIE